MKRLTFLLAVIFPVILFSQIIHIPADYPTIQAGIDASDPGATIVVDEGTYVERLVISEKPVTLGSKYLENGDTSYISKTIIDGNDKGSVVTFDGESIKPTYFTGFTIINGGGNDQLSGGGIVLIGSSPELDHLVIKSNEARRGGGIAVLGNSHLKLNNSRLVNNSASKKGGAIYAFNSSSEIDGCYFSQNIANGISGGAVCFEVNPDGEGEEINFIKNSEFVENACANGYTGGLYIDQSGEGTGILTILDYCRFTDNTGKGNAALSVKGIHSMFNIRNCLFQGNEAGEFTGGASFTVNSSGRLVNCLFFDNHAGTDNGNSNAGGATVWGGAQVDFVNCSFVENTASYGAGLSVGSGGRSMALNCIFWGNSNDQIALLDYDGNGGELHTDFINIQDGVDGISVSENSFLETGPEVNSLDPELITNGKYPCQLKNLSPCIDGGTPDTSGLKIPKYDLLGNLRVYDGDSNSAAIIDLGPYEYGSNPIGIFNIKISDPQLSVFPNPFSVSTTIEYELRQPETVQITIYNHLGKQLDIIQQKQSSGKQQMVWNAEGLPSGVYYCVLKTNSAHAGQTMKMIKLK